MTNIFQSQLRSLPEDIQEKLKNAGYISLRNFPPHNAHYSWWNELRDECQLTIPERNEVIITLYPPK